MKVMLNPCKFSIYQPTTPTFNGIRFNKKNVGDIFISEKSDLLSLSRNEIFSRIKKSLSDEKNKIGQGGGAKVWKIVDSDYCIRIPHSAAGNIFKKFSTRINDVDRENHIVAKLGENATIMRFIPGYVFGEDAESNEQISKMVENMPVRAYKNLILQIKNAESKKILYFDVGYKNVIINPENQTFTAIDFYKSNEQLPKGSLLAGIFSCLNIFANDEQKKISAGKLILAAIDLYNSNSKLSPIDLGINRLLYIITCGNLVENKNYINVLKNNFEKLLFKNDEQLGAERILRALVKQLFGVVSDKE